MTLSPEPDPKLEWLRFYCEQKMLLLPVYEVVDGGCSCGRPDCKERDWGKHSRIAWGAGATYNFDIVRQWHTRWPSANWAWALKDHFVIDIDPRNGGFPPDELYELWGNTLGFELPSTLQADTGGGGSHLVFQQPVGDRVRNGRLVTEDGRPLQGIDVKGDGGYILVYPSNHRLGHYSWKLPWVVPVEAPPELLEMCRRRGQARITPQRDEGVEAVEARENTRFDVDTWLAEASSVAPGFQHDHLVKGLGWLRYRGRAIGEMITLGWQVAGSYPTGDPSNPWTIEHVTELVADMRNRYEAGLSGSITIPNYVPVMESPAPTGDGDDGDSGAVIPIGGGGGQDDDVPNFNTDRRNAEDLKALFGHLLCWTPQLDWLAWAGTHWVEDDLRYRFRCAAALSDNLRARALQEADDAAREVLNARATRLDGVRGIEGMLKYAETIMAVDGADFDTDPYLLNVQNGVLDLRTLALRERVDGERFMRVTAVPYVQGAKSPLLEEFHREFLYREGYAEAAYRILGVVLFGGNVHRILPMMVGPTSTGKSQFSTGILKALGGYAEAANSSIFHGNMEDKARPDILSILSTRVAVLEESGQAWELHGDRMKFMTSATKVSVRKMHSNKFISKVPDFTPLFVANTMPRVKGSDGALARRIIVIPFKDKPEVEDMDKRDEFLGSKECLTALLAELVEGVRRFQAAGLEDFPQEFYESKADAMAQFDDISEFMDVMFSDNHLIKDGQAQITKCIKMSALHGIYVKMVKDFGDASQKRSMLGRKQFSMRLQELGYELKKSDGYRVIGILDPTYNPYLSSD